MSEEYVYMLVGVRQFFISCLLRVLRCFLIAFTKRNFYDGIFMTSCLFPYRTKTFHIRSIRIRNNSLPQEQTLSFTIWPFVERETKIVVKLPPKKWLRLPQIQSLFISGSVWVFGAYAKFYVDSDDSTEYCNKLVFLCSFWLLIATYCCLFIILLILAVLAFYFCIKSDGNKKQLPYNIQSS